MIYLIAAYIVGYILTLMLIGVGTGAYAPRGAGLFVALFWPIVWVYLIPQINVHAIIDSFARKIKEVSKGQSIDRYYLAKLLGLGAFLHNIHDSDPKGIFHTHPWPGVSVIFGNYVEERLLPSEFGMPPKLVRRRRWGFNLVAAKTPHRVEVFCPTWTLFIHWRKTNKWGIYDRFGQRVADSPWEGAEGEKDYTKAAEALTV